MKQNLNDMEGVKKEIAGIQWYHVLNIGDISTPGVFDMSKYVSHYKMPESLSGKSALDIGTASGYFAFELESRGANPVIATDLPDWDEHDFSQSYSIDDHEKLKSQTMLKNAFEIAKKYKSSKVERKIINIYDLGSQLDMICDFVICANVLLHLQNPYLALENIRKVTNEKAIIATTVYEARFRKKAPIMVYLNRPHLWYAPSPKCMELLSLQAGFSRCEYLGSYIQKPENADWHDKVGIWHMYP